jgi:HSP90 family molecular chaperone
MKFKNTAADYSSTVGQGKKMGFAPEAQSFLMDMMSDGLYSNKYGSIVRELASNCIDANTESGSTEPISVKLTKPSSFTAKGEISFADTGIGISPERVEDIFTLYFASTKRDGNEMIGGFGIGAKSPFAYTDVFRVETWVEGTHYMYLMEKRGEDRTCTLITEEPCDVADHGTIIRIPIKDTWDYEKFVEAVNEQTLLMR